MARKDDDGKKPADAGEEENGDQPLLKPISPVQRKRFQKCFEHGSKLSSKGEFDYADQMFHQCVVGDPGNIIYTQSLLTNLIKKYRNNKKGGKLAGLKGAGAKAGMKKGAAKKDWVGVIRSGLEYLRLNPWDMGALTELSKACGELELDDCQMAYLKLALDANPKDLALNRLAADSFASIGQFDDAIRCLERIAHQKPKDQAIQREINHMTVQGTIHKGGYEDATSSIDVSVDKKAAEQKTGGTIELTEEQQLRREIRRHPEEVTNHISLSNYYFKLEDFAMAEQVMQEAVESTGSVRATEELEDIQIHRAGLELVRAQQQAAEKKTSEAKSLYKRMKEELNKRELEVYRSRCERYPGDFALKYELGMRLKRAGMYEEAIKQFQQSRNESRKKATSNLETGECFQQIKQYRLAMQSYQEAIETCGTWDEEVKKLALYRAGWLAKGLKEYDDSRKYLSDLAGLDFSYKDVSKLLDEVSKKCNESGDLA